MQQATIYLRPREKELLDGIPGALKDGLAVEDEIMESDERADEIRMRHLMYKSGSKACDNIINALYRAGTEDEIISLASSFDFSGLSQEEAAEIFFTVGTGVLSVLMAEIIKNAETNEDLEGAANLSVVRHFLLESNASVSF